MNRNEQKYNQFTCLISVLIGAESAIIQRMNAARRLQIQRCPMLMFAVELMTIIRGFYSPLCHTIRCDFMMRTNLYLLGFKQVPCRRSRSTLFRLFVFIKYFCVKLIFSLL